MMPKLWLLFALVAAPAFAAQKPAYLYPLQGDGIDPALVTDAQGLVQSALVRWRDGAWRQGEETPLVGVCGPAKAATNTCLSKLAADGVVLRGWLVRSGYQYDLFLSAVDAAQRKAGPVSVKIDLTIENPEPVMAALQRLSETMSASGQRPPPPPKISQRPPQPQLSPAPAPQQAAPVPQQAATKPLTTKLDPQPQANVPPAALEPAPQTSKLARYGKWTAAGGLVLLAGGTVVGILDRSLNSQLNDKFQQHTLTAADASSYSQVKTYNVVATSLFIAGGAAVLTGLGMWIAAPSDDQQRAEARGAR